MPPVLIDAGRSRFGWSRHGAFFHCMQLGAYTEILKLPLNDEKEPIERGILGHLGAAHQFARWRQTQRREDPNAYYPREDAMALYCETHPASAPHLDRMIDTLRRYFTANPEPPGKVTVVEEEFTGVCGWLYDTKKGAYVTDARGAARFDIWLIRQDAADTVDPDVAVTALPYADDGFAIIPSPLGVAGHAREHAPVYVSRRWDLAYENRKGQVILVDHKFTSADASKSRARKYASDGQFSINRILARQAWPGRFTGDVYVALNRTLEPWAFRMFDVPATPWRDRTIAYQLHMRARMIARLLVEGVDPWHFPRADHELVCSHRYGDCEAIDLCDHGPGVLQPPPL